MMHPEDKADQIALYDARLASVDRSDENLSGMGPWLRQGIRFDALLGVGNMAGKSVLDVGCGVGGFYRHAMQLVDPIKMDYTGIDLVPGLIDQAKLRSPGVRFVVGDFLETDVPRYDYVVANGTFNALHIHGDNMKFLMAALKKGLDIAHRGVAFTLMSHYVDYRDDHLYYFDPTKVFGFCKTLTPRVVLRHDLPLYEFVIYLYPDSAPWRKFRTGEVMNE